MTHAHSRKRSFIAWGLLFLSFAAWGGFVYLTYFLDAKRTDYINLSVLAVEESERQESSTRLRALIQGTEVERAALESVMGVRIVDAAETVEAALDAAGARDITISEANAGAPNTQGISSVSMGVNASGSFTTLMRATLMLEALPLPSMIEQFELSEDKDEWRLVARLRLTLANVQ